MKKLIARLYVVTFSAALAAAFVAALAYMAMSIAAATFAPALIPLISSIAASGADNAGAHIAAAVLLIPAVPAYLAALDAAR